MTTPQEPPQREAAAFTAIRSWGLTRGDNGFMGGVIDGLSQRVGMATVPARIVVVIAGLFLSGLVLIAYAAAWALLPDRRGNIIIQNFARGVPNVGALIGIGLMLLFGLGGLNNSVPFVDRSVDWSDGGIWGGVAIVFGVIIPLAFVGGLVWLIVVLVKRSQASSPVLPGAPVPGVPVPGAPVPGTPAAAMPGAATATATAAAPSPAYAAGPPAPPAFVAPPSYPVPPAPPVRPRVPGPGRGFYLMALAWSVLSAAGVAWADREDMLAVHPFVAWFAVFVAGLGVMLVLISLTGRKLGFLGFLGVTMALPTLGLAAAADDIRDSYLENDSAISIDLDPYLEPIQELSAYDATEEFGKTYTEVVVNGWCTNADELWTEGQSTARYTYTEVSEDVTIDATAEVTYLTIPAGVNVVVSGVGDAQATVAWPERDLSCDFWNQGGTHLSLVNPGGPTVNVVVRDDDFVNTIVITEEQS